MPSDNLNYIEQSQSSPRYGTPPVSVGEGTNYVEYGCTVEAVDDTHLLATLRGGRVHLFTAGPPERWFVVDVDPRRDVQLEANATNEIYVVINGAATAKPTTDVVVSTSGAPAALSLHVTTIDTTSTPASVAQGMNRSPEIGTENNPVKEMNTDQVSITEREELTDPSSLPTGATTLEYVNGYLVMTEGE